MIYNAVLFDWGGTIKGRDGIPNFVCRLVRDLYQSGYRIGIVSNSHRYGDVRWLRNQIAQLELTQYIEVVAGSGGMIGEESKLGSGGCHKPDIEIYRKVCDFIGVPFDKCVFVGDSWQEDIAKPASLGMATLHVNVDEHDYSADLWNLLLDDPTNRQILTTFQSNMNLTEPWHAQCQLRDLTEPIKPGDRLILGLKETVVQSVSFAHTKDDILDTSHAGRKILSITMAPHWG